MLPIVRLNAVKVLSTSVGRPFHALTPCSLKNELRIAFEVAKNVENCAHM